ncbi:MAG: hypothetical protein ACJAYU_000654 [Bradymonadia bacterium]|jgi:hypothetical protein
MAFVGFVVAVMSVSSQRADAEVQRWEISTEGKIVLEPDLTVITQEAALYILVFGEDVRHQWMWNERSVINLTITEYGSEYGSDTQWCSARRVPLPGFRDAQACNLYLTWQPGVSSAARINGALPDLPSDYRVELVAVPYGLVGEIRDGRRVSWVFGIAYLLGCVITVASVRRRRKLAGSP